MQHPLHNSAKMIIEEVQFKVTMYGKTKVDIELAKKNCT